MEPDATLYVNWIYSTPSLGKTLFALYETPGDWDEWRNGKRFIAKLPDKEYPPVAARPRIDRVKAKTNGRELELDVRAKDVVLLRIARLEAESGVAAKKWVSKNSPLKLNVNLDVFNPEPGRFSMHLDGRIPPGRYELQLTAQGRMNTTARRAVKFAVR